MGIRDKVGILLEWDWDWVWIWVWDIGRMIWMGFECTWICLLI